MTRIIDEPPAEYLVDSVWDAKASDTIARSQWANTVDGAVRGLARAIHGSEQVAAIDADDATSDTLSVTTLAKPRMVHTVRRLWFRPIASDTNERYFDFTGNTNGAASKIMRYAWLAPIPCAIVRLMFRFLNNNNDTTLRIYKNAGGPAEASTTINGLTGGTLYTWDPTPIVLAAGDHINISSQHTNDTTVTLPQWAIGCMYVRHHWDAVTLPDE